MGIEKNEARSSAEDRAPERHITSHDQHLIDKTSRETQAKNLRLRRLTAKVHALGEGPLFYLFADLERGVQGELKVDFYAQKAASLA